MVRTAVSVVALLTLLAPAAAQTPPATTALPAQTATPAKPAAKKAAKPKAAPAKPAEQTTAGPCGIGVIAATQEPFVVEKIGLTVFGNEYAEVPVSWGLDDLVFARARAAAGATPLRRIAYAKGAFDTYYHPKPSLFRNDREELSNLVRQIATHGVDGIREVFPCTGNARHDRLSTQLSICSDLARDARHFRGERTQLIHHRIDGFF